jgi:hypothetical protein
MSVGDKVEVTSFGAWKFAKGYVIHIDGEVIVVRLIDYPQIVQGYRANELKVLND